MLINIAHVQMVDFLIGLGGGAVIGPFLTTDMELRKRGFVFQKISPFARIPLMIAIKMILVEGAFLLVIGSTFVAVSLGISRLAGEHEPHERSFLYVVGFVAGLGAGKFARYLYWRARQTGL